MNIIIGGKSSGKTTKAIQLVKDNPDLLFVTPLQKHKRNLQKQYPEIKDRIVCPSDMITGRKEKEVVLDNAELYLSRLFLDEHHKTLHTIVLEEDNHPLMVLTRWLNEKIKTEYTGSYNLRKSDDYVTAEQREAKARAFIEVRNYVEKLKI